MWESCQKSLIFNPVVTMGTQISCILVMSQFFYLALKPLGQPGPIAQILAGVVLGPSGLSRIGVLKDFFFQNSATNYYQTMAVMARVVFMFLIGLELDIPYIMRHLRLAGTIACGGGVMCSIFAAAISPFIYRQFDSQGSMFSFVLVLMMMIANTASPVVVRIITDLKLATSNVGRLAISSALVNDMACLLLLSILRFFQPGNETLWRKLLEVIGVIIFVVVIVIVNNRLAFWLNRRNRNRKYLKNAEVYCILALLFGTSMAIEAYGQNSMIPCFVLGVMLPREGKTIRTLLHKLGFFVHNFVLPIYFGYTGFQMDLTQLGSIRSISVVVVMVVLSIGGKISGTLAACHYLKLPLSEGVVLAFLLNLKGFVDLLVISIASETHKWGPEVYTVLLTTIVINTLIVGPIAAFIVNKERKSFGYRHMALESQDPESELRMLACVHGVRNLSIMVELIGALSGSRDAPIVPYLMHLVEFPDKPRTDLTYHQQENANEDFSDAEEYGVNDEVEINDAVDAFSSETGILIRQMKAVAAFETMFEDVCNTAEEIRASIILIPFHKHQRIDGKMENGKEGIRTTNHRVLRHAPCSVALLVDRGLGGTPQASSLDSSLDTDQHVATLFFGGPDDREALAFGRRIGVHSRINLTVIRFLHESSRDAGIDVASHQDDHVLMRFSSHGTENEVDNAFLSDFYSRYVTTGQVGYVEKLVNDGAETATALREMGDMYSLFIVGKGGRGHSPVTTGMSDWEECPELGTVGDLLASPEFDIRGSVLVIQRHRHSKNDLMDEE
ncbi:hypothetical protein L1049_001761 [Liquidambar formosana]